MLPIHRGGQDPGETAAILSHCLECQFLLPATSSAQHGRQEGQLLVVPTAPLPWRTRQFQAGNRGANSCHRVIPFLAPDSTSVVQMSPHPITEGATEVHKVTGRSRDSQIKTFQNSQGLERKEWSSCGLAAQTPFLCEEPQVALGPPTHA